MACEVVSSSPVKAITIVCSSCKWRDSYSEQLEMKYSSIKREYRASFLPEYILQKASSHKRVFVTGPLSKYLVEATAKHLLSLLSLVEYFWLQNAHLSHHVYRGLILSVFLPFTLRPTF